MNTTTHWQTLIEKELYDVLYFFVPKIARIVDFEKPIDFFTTPKHILSQTKEREQHNLLLGLRDKDKQPMLLLLTLEYGGYDNRKFEERLFRDFTATLEEVAYKIPVTSLVLFLANSIPTGMNGYEYDFLETKVNMEYTSYAVREQYFDDLWELKNPITFAVASSRIAIETKEHPTVRLEKKKELLDRLLNRYLKKQLSLEKATHLLDFITSVLPLDNKHEAQFQSDLINSLYHQSDIATTDKATLIAAASND